MSSRTLSIRGQGTGSWELLGVLFPGMPTGRKGVFHTRRRCALWLRAWVLGPGRHGFECPLDHGLAVT